MAYINREELNVILSSYLSTEKSAEMICLSPIRLNDAAAIYLNDHIVGYRKLNHERSTEFSSFVLAAMDGHPEGLHNMAKMIQLNYVDLSRKEQIIFYQLAAELGCQYSAVELVQYYMSIEDYASTGKYLNLIEDKVLSARSNFLTIQPY